MREIMLKFKWCTLIAARNLSLFEFIKDSGLKQAQVYNWAKGKNLPSLDRAILLRDHYAELTGEFLTVEEFWDLE